MTHVKPVPTEPKQEVNPRDQMIEDLFVSCTRWITAQNIFERAIAAEGTPAVRDAGGGFLCAIDEAVKAYARIVGEAADELHRLRAAQKADENI